MTGYTSQLSSYTIQESTAVTFYNIFTLLTSTSRLEIHFLHVLMDPSTRLSSVFNKIWPPAPRDTTCCPISDARSLGLGHSLPKRSEHSITLRLVIHSSSAQLEVTQWMPWCEGTALHCFTRCLLYDTLLQLTRALAGDWLTTRQHHPQSPVAKIRIF
jgi:hypothetical protein